MDSYILLYNKAKLFAKLAEKYKAEIGKAELDPRYEAEIGKAELDPQYEVEIGKAVIDESKNNVKHNEQIKNTK